MKRVRVSIEWNYGATASLFRYIGNKGKLSILGHRTIAKIYTVATILRNLNIGYYGCQSSNYFNVALDENFVEKYITQTDF